MALGRGEREWTLLVSEYNICKKKLESKREALQILMKDLSTCQKERDIYKAKINQLQQENDRCKQREEREKAAARTRETQAKERARLEWEKKEKEETRGYGHSVWDQELQSIRQRKNKTLSQLLCDVREENQALQKDLANLRQLYKEAQEDILLLRENIAKQSNLGGSQGGATQDVSARQDLIIQLEEHQENIADLERDLQAAVDEKSEVSVERDHFRDKSEHLNTQLNYILGADDRRLVDIDAVLMKNRYMKEQIKQLKEEKGLASAAVARYKAAFEKRRNKLMKAVYIGHSAVTKHTLSSILQDLSGVQGGQVSSAAMSDLQFLANSLSESLTDKDIALAHQKNTNKILGARVAELEKKLKTLEVAGLWSLPGHRGYGSREMEIVNRERKKAGHEDLKPETVESPEAEVVYSNESETGAKHTQENLHEIRARLLLPSTGSESEDEFERSPSSPDFLQVNLTEAVESSDEILVNVASSPPSTGVVAESCTSRAGCVTNGIHKLPGYTNCNPSCDGVFGTTPSNGSGGHTEYGLRESKTNSNEVCTTLNVQSNGVNECSIQTQCTSTENGCLDYIHIQSDKDANITESLITSTCGSGSPESDSRCLSPDSAAFEAEMEDLTLRVSSNSSEAGSESGHKSTEEEFSEYTGYVDTNILGNDSPSDPRSPVQSGKTVAETDQLQELGIARECLSDSELAQLLYNVSSAEEF